MRGLNSVTLHYPAVGAGRLQLLDELRGLAILQVVTYHVCGVTGFPNISHGELGVDIFVLLSGMALTLNHRPEEGTGRFLWRRYARLLPAYWIALTLCWAGGTLLLRRSYEATDVVSHYLGIHSLWGDKYILNFNDSFWFLGLIVPLYLVYAVLRRWLHRADLVVGVGLCLCFALTYCTAKVWNQPATFLHLGLRPPIFFVGLVFGLLLRNGVVHIPLSAWIAFGVLLTWYGTLYTGLLVGYNIAGFAVFFTYFVLRNNADEAGRRWLCRLMAGLGLISYELFLLHQPLIRDYNHYVWNKVLEVATPSPVQLGIGVAVGLFVAVHLAQVVRWIAGKASRAITR